MTISRNIKDQANKFAVIYADPPWRFSTYSEKGRDRSPDRHYPTMTIKEIKALNVESLAKDDCVLLMWSTMPMLPQALEVIKAWGFTYKTVGFTWMKQNPKAPTLFYDANDIFAGNGYWTRANCELCILATRGHPKRKSSGVAQAIFSPLRQHSRKPSEVYGRIEELLAGPYVELFARTKRDGWVSLGNQVKKFGCSKPNGAGLQRSKQPPRGKKK